ncbi:MAG: OmpH family outer membrane protein, partial [Bacteroidota bacterium]|nr:OmpH family outer membrane protein [Bacteroidota bacterium]
YQELQQNAQNDLMQKQQEKMTPIFDKLKEAINAVAKEKGYDYVVDTSEGSGIIYSAPKDDIMLAVKQKLGIE